MNVRRALPKIHFDQTLYRKANTQVFAINTSLHAIGTLSLDSDIILIHRRSYIRCHSI